MISRGAAPLDCVLVLVCRRPRSQHGKRRLAATIGERLASQIGDLMLHCALEDLRAWRGAVAVAPESAEDFAWARELPARHPRSRSAMTILAQGPGNLGMRLRRMDRALTAKGYRRRIYIGSDAPVLDKGHYRRVMQGLCTHDVVLPAARDGGVTTMATRRGWPTLAALPWGTPGLAAALSAACRKLGWSVLQYPGGFDVDRGSDLARLHRALIGDPRKARRALLAWLARNRLIE